MPPSNPFDDDDDPPPRSSARKDTNPFASSAPPAPRRRESTNPFERNDGSIPPRSSTAAPRRATTVGLPASSTTNPFEDDGGKVTPSPPRRTMLSASAPSIAASTNPFEVGSPSRAVTIAPAVTAAGSSGGTNPFDDGPSMTPTTPGFPPVAFPGAAAAATATATAFVSNLKRPTGLSNLFRAKTAGGDFASTIHEDVEPTEDDEPHYTAHDDSMLPRSDAAPSSSSFTNVHRRAQSVSVNLQSSAMGWLKRGSAGGGRGVDAPPLTEEGAAMGGGSMSPFDGAAPTAFHATTSSTGKPNPFDSPAPQAPAFSTATPLSFLNEAGKGLGLPTTANNNKEKKKKQKKKKETLGKKTKQAASGVMEGIKKGKLGLAPVWPYDDYHKEQPFHAPYENMSRTRSYSDAEQEFGGATSGNDDDGPTKGNSTSNGGLLEENIHGKLYERPSDLPTISEAVQDLSLVEFETKAEERAIAIVSMWLHDSGLIDDLLVTGTPGYAALTKRSRMAAGLTDDATVMSTKTSEGVEVGMQGFPMAETFKLEKEVEWLRSRVQRELTLVNARLNDGVAASGAEVQELVNAVAATKGDLGRLRKMTTYITQGVKNQDEFILTNCPRLRSIMNARRNLFTCFRELEFFDQMPATCERLREELHSGEWTTEEWKTIRSVSMEHVELEILLVEAEAGMKARLTEEQPATNEFVGGHSNYHGNLPLNAQERSNYEAVDRFLSAHVKNVWELGDEIKMRIMSGLGSSFDLAKNNPADMVALVEAVEVYERAAEHYKALYETSKGKESSKLRFTDMRASALKQMYEHFQTRGLDVFREIQMRAEDAADEQDDPENRAFSAVLGAATELVAEIDVVKNVLAPCFPPRWAVEVLWSSCIAYVCSNNILQQIGGPQGSILQELTVTQLLDLVAWVEYFREHIEESFPQVATLRSSKNTYFDSMPNLFTGEQKKEIDMESATDSLAWANNMLWDVHRLAQSEFLQRIRFQIDDWLDNVYSASRTHEASAEGKLTTSLCEDLFSLVGIELRTIREHLSPSSEALVMAVCLIFSNLRMKQIHARDNFLKDLESSCAAANDFTRMSELCEEALVELQRECQLDEDVRDTLDASASEVLAVYSADAVYAAQSTHVFIFEPIHEAIAGELFGGEWEQNLTHNELALTLVRTIEDFMGDLEQFLDDFLLVKTVDALVSATVVFYVRCLLVKAENHPSTKVGLFQDTRMALDRMTGDVRVMTEFFEGLIPRMPSLKRVIEKEFEFFTALYELMSIAAGLSESDASNFIIVVHKLLTGNIDLTKHFVGDIWHLVNPAEEKEVWELIDSMEEQLEAIATKSEEAIRQAMDRQQVPGLRLDRMMADLYLQSKRKLPIKSSTFEKMVNTLKMDWVAQDKEGKMSK